MNKTLCRKLAVTDDATFTLAGATLRVAAITNASPIRVTLGTDNPSGSTAGYHSWNDGTMVTIAGGSVPAAWIEKKYYKIKTVSGEPTQFDLYNSDGSATAAPGATTLTGTWTVTPYFAPGMYTVSLSVLTGAVRYSEGGYPTTGATGVGIYLAAGEKKVIKCDPNDLRFIAASATHAIVDFEIIPFTAGEFLNDIPTPTSTGISVTASVAEATGIVVLGYDDTDPQSATKPGMFTRLTNGTAFNSAAAPLNAAVNGVNGTGIATMVNPFPVLEGGFTSFARGTFHGLTVQATTPAAVGGTAGMKIFGSSTSATAAASKLGHVDMGFIARRVMVRNNGGTPVHLGWVAGESTTGGLIDNIVLSGAGGSANVLVTTKAAHGLPAGTSPVFIAGCGALLTEDIVQGEGYHIATYQSATQFSLDLSTLTTGTEETDDWGYWYAGFDSYVQPASYVASTATLGGFYCEASSIPNDWTILPYNIAALFVLNPAGGATVTNTAFKAEVVFLR